MQMMNTNRRNTQAHHPISVASHNVPHFNLLQIAFRIAKEMAFCG